MNPASLRAAAAIADELGFVLAAGGEALDALQPDDLALARVIDYHVGAELRVLRARVRALEGERKLLAGALLAGAR